MSQHLVKKLQAVDVPLYVYIMWDDFGNRETVAATSPLQDVTASLNAAKHTGVMYEGMAQGLEDWCGFNGFGYESGIAELRANIQFEIC